jgi:hypothetical protein
VSISDQPQSTLSEGGMTWPYYMRALLGCNLWHADHFTSVG